MENNTTKNLKNTIFDTFAFNNQVPKYMKQIWTKLNGEVDNSTIIIRDLNTSLSIMSRSLHKRATRKPQLDKTIRPNRYL